MDAPSPKHIAIVGCGFTGVSAFYQLINGYQVAEVSIFESTGNFGPGYAYQPDECTDYLLNNTTQTMCLGPENRRAFLDWLETHPELEADLSPNGHLPRRLFGLFLKDMLEATKLLARKKRVICNFIAETVTCVEEKSDTCVKISWPNGSIDADAAIMATGRCPNLPITNSPATGSIAKFFDCHVNTIALDQLAMDADVHIIGASLSAYDVINRLFSEHTGCKFEQRQGGELIYLAGPNKRRVTLYSRSGRLKKMQSRSPQPIDRDTFSLPALRQQRKTKNLRLRDIASAIKADGMRHNAEFHTGKIEKPYANCNSVVDVNQRAGEILASDIAAAKNGDGANFLVDLVDHAQMEIWDGFTEKLLAADEERRYRQSVETAMLAYAAPCPIPTAERLLALHRAGCLNIVYGANTPALSQTGDYFSIKHTHGEATANILINATGKVDRDVSSSGQPSWVKSLIASDKLRRYSRNGIEMDGAEIDMSTFRPPGLNRIYFANMYLWGPGFFTSSAFIMANVVARILNHIFPGQASDK